MIIKLFPEAEKDLQKALDYYFDIDRNLESKFIFDLESTYERILKFPNLYIHETKTAQKILMEIFPYIVLYEQHENIIMFLAIFHTSRDDEELNVKTFETENIFLY